MAISKKSLGKILAISLASAMAMSSLSAALVSVSAVADPALASNGNVSLNDATTAELPGVATNKHDVEKAIREVIGADDDNHVDSIAGGKINLKSTITPILTKTGAIKYTDNNGLAADESYVSVSADDITYRVTGGGASYDKETGILTGGSKKGSATLTITIKGEVELGGGKSKKSVTLKHTIDIDNHEVGDYGLVAYKDGERLTESDLNNLAAYGETIDFTVVQYGKDDPTNASFPATLTTVIANSDSTAVPGAGSVAPADLWKVLEPKLKALKMDEKVFTPAVTDAEGNVTTPAVYVIDEIKRQIDAAGATTTPVVSTVDDVTDHFTLGLTKATEAVRGYEISLKTYSAANAKKAYDSKGTVWNAEADDASRVEDLGTTDSAAAYTALNAADGSKVFKYQGKVYCKDGATLADTNDGDVGKYWEKASPEVNAWVVDDGSVANSEPASGNFVKVYECSKKTAITNGNLSPVSVYDNTTQDSDGKTEYEKLLDRAKAALKAADAKIKEADGTLYFELDATNKTKPTLTDLELNQVIDAVDASDEDSANNLLGQEIVPADPSNSDTDSLKAINNAYYEAWNSVSGSEVGRPGKIRFYAGTGEDLFDISGSSDKWEKGNKSTSNTKGVTIANGSRSVVTLETNGSTGSGSVKVSVPPKTGTTPDELVLDVKVVKAVDATGMDVTVKKSGSKTYIEGDSALTEEKNISNYEIRNAKTLTIENGTLGKIVDIVGNITVNGGRTGAIDSENSAVTVTEDGIVGDIIAANGVTVNEGGRAGKVTDAWNVLLNEGTIESIDTDGTVTIEGGTVNGDIIAEGEIKITSEAEDSNDNPLDTVIKGNIIASGEDATITIDNESDDGAAEISIGGYVLARYVDTTEHNDGTVKIGSADTTGPIQVKGAVEGEYVVLGGNGLLNLAGVRAANEVEHNDDDGEIVESTLKFAGFNSAINSISNFADVIVDEGTVTVKGAVKATNLTVGSDAQIVADEINIEDDIMESGSIVVPVGKLTVTGSVDDAPTLTFLGDVKTGDLGFVGNRGLVDAFETNGITLTAQRQSDGNYHYMINKVELSSLTAVGKNVVLGVGQTKTVSVALDGTLPEGASIEWSVDDSDIATVEGNGMTATITGKEIDDTTVTAKIVDANGRDLGYDDASFEVNVLGVNTVDSIGGDIGPDENEVDLDTTKKNMQVGQTYTFLVRGNNDVANLSVVSSDTSVATVGIYKADDSRGALYQITAVADGKADIVVNYQGKTSRIAVKVGGFQLDTASKTMAPGQTYSFLAKNVPADQAGNVTLAFDNNIVDVVKAADDYNGRGVLYTVTAKAIGQTAVNVTYNGETEAMNVSVAENNGKLTLDTRSYTMPIGGTYTIGVKVEKNGTELTGAQVRDLINSGELVIRDSRSGHVVTHQVQDNGNIRVTGVREGTTYIMVEVVQKNGQAVTHASVGVTVQAGATAHGDAARSISVW